MRDLGGDALFLDPSLDWREVSPSLVTERRLAWLVPVLLAVVLLVLGVILKINDVGPLWPFLAAASVLLALWALGWFWIVPRTVSSWRYAEREQDLLVRRGRVTRRLTIVPYGRMQVIEVSANLVAQRLGIATVTLVTASASTDARIPGVPAAVAQELRDRLAAKGEATAAGI